LLHLAVLPTPFCSYENVRIVNALLAAEGTDISRRDSDGFSALDLARRQRSGVLLALMHPEVESDAKPPSVPPEQDLFEYISLDADSADAVRDLALKGIRLPPPLLPEVRGQERSWNLVTERYSGEYYDVVLLKSFFDKEQLVSCYFHLQLLQDDADPQSFQLATVTGSVNQPLRKFANRFSVGLESALEEFNQLFFLKTSHKWSLRASFKRAQGRYMIMSRSSLQACCLPLSSLSRPRFSTTRCFHPICESRCGS
jgi:hypothetical protein